MSAITTLITNGGNLLRFLKDFTSSTPQDVSITYKNADGSEDVSIIPNTAQFRKRVWDDVGSALGQFNRTFYVDAVNGSDANIGDNSNPFQTIKKAIDSAPYSGSVQVVFLSDIDWNEDISSTGRTITLSLNGYKLNLVKRLDNNTSLALLYSLLGYGNLVFVYGNSNNDSAVILPALGDDTIFSLDHSVWIKSAGSGEPECTNLHFGYNANIIDSGDFYLMSCGSGTVGTFGFTGSTFTADVNKPRDVKDLVSGVIKDTNGVPRNIQSNLIF